MTVNQNLKEMFFVDQSGAFMGTWFGHVPETGLEVQIAPTHASQIWDFDTQTWSVYNPRNSMPPLNARQIRLGLIANGFSLSQVTGAIAAMPDGPDKEIAQVEWEYAPTFERLHHLIGVIGAVLGLTDEQIDVMWMSSLLI